MAILHIPSAGRIVICDYSGFIPPEMVKKRPVVVISPKSYNHPELCSVIPLSTTEPKPLLSYHYAFNENPIPNRAELTWAKCDLLCTVSKQRLDRVKIGRGKYTIPKISPDELEAIRHCIRQFLKL